MVSFLLNIKRVIKMKLKSYLGNNKGQALIETAFTFPIIILFCFAFMQFAYMAIAYQVVNYAAFMGARSYIVHEDAGLSQGVTTKCLQPIMWMSARSPEILTANESKALAGVKVTFYQKIEFPLIGELFVMIGGTGTYIPIKSFCRMNKPSL